VIVFALLAVGALALCVVGQVLTRREETERLRREHEALLEKFGPLESRTEYR
jgi:hypothetical protein